MKNFIFDIIKKRREEKDREGKRVPLYKEAPDVERQIKNDPLKKDDKYVEIDFNIDHFDINNEMKL
jgi:hypothetical protein